MFIQFSQFNINFWNNYRNIFFRYTFSVLCSIFVLYILGPLCYWPIWTLVGKLKGTRKSIVIDCIIIPLHFFHCSVAFLKYTGSSNNAYLFANADILVYEEKPFTAPERPRFENNSRYTGYYIFRNSKKNVFFKWHYNFIFLSSMWSLRSLLRERRDHPQCAGTKLLITSKE